MAALTADDRRALLAALAHHLRHDPHPFLAGPIVLPDPRFFPDPGAVLSTLLRASAARAVGRGGERTTRSRALQAKGAESGEAEEGRAHRVPGRAHPPLGGPRGIVLAPVVGWFLANTFDEGLVMVVFFAAGPFVGGALGWAARFEECSSCEKILSPAAEVCATCSATPVGRIARREDRLAAEDDWERDRRTRWRAEKHDAPSRTD